MCRVLRRTIVHTRKPRMCSDCGRPIGKGEECSKTEYAEPLAPSSREGIRTEWSCCNLNAKRINWWNGPNATRYRPPLRAEAFKVA